MTTMTAPSGVSVSRSAWSVIWPAWVVCGVLDISAACINAYLVGGRSPGWVLHAVASGLLGKKSFELGALAAGFGLALHFAVALAWTALFYVLSRRFAGLGRQAVASGVIYGAFLYAAMNAAVLPLASWFRSLYLHTPVSGVAAFAWPQFFIHLTCVGLAISLMIRRGGR